VVISESLMIDEWVIGDLSVIGGLVIDVSWIRQ
jgi:hypothetical protein